ncbi:MAG: response regulator [Candidatus Binatia bacterium]|jgi:CheY-like chemotaxis protein
MEKRKILLIDDDVQFTDLLKNYLNKTGKYEVRVQNNGSRGLDSAKAFKPDLIVLDFVMPDMDGSEVAELILDDEDVKNIPLVFLTSIVADEEVKPTSGLIGGIRFIAKLQPMRKLIASIEENIPR